MEGRTGTKLTADRAAHITRPLKSFAEPLRNTAHTVQKLQLPGRVGIRRLF